VESAAGGGRGLLDHGEPEEPAERGGQGSPGEAGSVVVTAATTDARIGGIAQAARGRNR